MRKLGLGRLLLLILLLPLLALAGFAGVLVDESRTSYQEMQRVAALQRLVSATHHFSMVAMPGEGFASYPYIASGSEELRAKLMEQRKVTDRAFADLKEMVAAAGLTDQKVLDLVRGIETRMGNLAAARQKVDARTMTRPEMTGVLQPNTAAGIDIIGRVAGYSEAGRIARHILALQAAMQMTDGSLIEGGRGDIAFKDGALDPAQYRLFIHGLELQATFGKQL